MSIASFVYGCDCSEFKRQNGITIDSQDAIELGWKACPFCHKPFRMTSQSTPPTEAEATEAVAKALCAAWWESMGTELREFRPWQSTTPQAKAAWRSVATRSRNIWDRVLTGQEP